MSSSQSFKRTTVPIKAIAQLVAAVLAAVIPALIDDRPMEYTEWINVGILGASAVNVYLASNHYTHPAWKYTKTAVSALAVVGVITVSTVGGTQLTGAEIATTLAPGQGKHENRQGM